MDLAPAPREILARALSDLRIGLPVAVMDAGAGILLLAAESTADARLNWILRQDGAVMTVTVRRAETLKARVYDGDIARLRPPPDADCRWVRSVADPALDLRFPLKGPFFSDRGGPLALHRAGIELMRRTRLLPAALSCPVTDAGGFAAAHGLACLTVEMISSEHGEGNALSPAAALLPLADCPQARIRVFRTPDGTEDQTVIEIGEPTRDEPVLTRIHSACFTGDVLGSLKCDCGQQLRSAVRLIAEAGSGLLLYLNQEGRGIGLTNKVRAYALQDQGFDTVEANHRLGFEDDERDFRVAGGILRQMGYSRARLLTNNPSKIQKLQAQGIEVTERIPLTTAANPFNEAYLTTKAKKSGHIL
ncbi:MAG: GTP cyclohydrolase II [Rhodobacteraceae bacterium]|nr:GTP cyclohydrolase II [Paracoccaceae bacterium]